MDKDAELKKAFQELIGAKPNLPVPGVVQEVSGGTCKVKIASGLVVSDVKLTATINGDSDFIRMVPVVGSDVLMLSLTGTLDNLCVIKVDRIAKFQYSQNGLILEADTGDNKISIKNSEVSLTEIFAFLGTLLKQLKFFTNSGVSGLPIPASLADIAQFETMFKQLLKED